MWEFICEVPGKFRSINTRSIFQMNKHIGLLGDIQELLSGFYPVGELQV